MMGQIKYISVAIMVCFMHLLLAASAVPPAAATHQSEWSFDNSMMNAYSINNNEDDEDYANENLIHIPMRSRASVLKERNLLHILEEEMDEDAATTFAKWASKSNNYDGRSLRQNKSWKEGEAMATEQEGGGGTQRVLQEFSGEGTHFLDAYVGTPAQKRVLAVSSGADFTAFPCEVRLSCSECSMVEFQYHFFSVLSHMHHSLYILWHRKNRKGLHRMRSNRVLVPSILLDILHHHALRTMRRRTARRRVRYQSRKVPSAGIQPSRQVRMDGLRGARLHLRWRSRGGGHSNEQ